MARAPALVDVWETDPAPGVVVARPLPDAARRPLAFRLDHRKPPARCAPGTPGFRYWVAAEALRRTADLWAPCLPGGLWRLGPVLPVKLNAGEAFNAIYNREALTFFHGPAPPGTAPHGTIYASESPDIVCHEMGHAVLDTLKPALWQAASHEAAAFHESFGDISAILAALQVPELRVAVLAETGGELARNSRLIRLGEQMGAAIRARAPDAVDRDCLRNAANDFTYRDPLLLPAKAPAAELSAEPHSFSRVFTAAFLEALAGVPRLLAPAPDEAALLAASHLMRDVLAQAVRDAPVAPNLYAQVAQAMVNAAAARHPGLPPLLAGVFARRAILPPEGVASPVAAGPAVLAVPTGHPSLPSVLVHEAAPEAARGFVAALFEGGRVEAAGVPAGGRLRTHRLQADGGDMVLHRCLFDCGLMHL